MAVTTCTSSYSYIARCSVFAIIFVLCIVLREIVHLRRKSCVFVKMWNRVPCAETAVLMRAFARTHGLHQMRTCIYEASASNNHRWSVFYNVRAFRITDFIWIYMYCVSFFSTRPILLLLFLNYNSQYLFCCIRFSCWWFCCRRFYSITLVFSFAFYLL